MDSDSDSDSWESENPSATSDRRYSAEMEQRPVASYPGWVDGSSSEDDVDVAPPKKRNLFYRLRYNIWIFFDVPTSSRPAMVWGAFIVCVIIASVILFMIETLPEYTEDPPLVFFILESIIIGIFTFELLVRFLTTPSYIQFIKGPLNWVDVICVVPYYIELGLDGAPNLSWIRVLRLIRVFRIFKLGRYQEGFLLFYLTFRLSLSTLALGISFLVMGMVIFSSFIFYAEQTYAHFDDDEEQWVYNDDTILGGELSFFQSIPHSFWWCIVTMTTVGYGDTYPISPLGKLVAAITFLGGLAIIAFPIAILGSKFLELYLETEERKQRRQNAKLKLMKEKQTNTTQRLEELYPFFPPPVRQLLEWKTDIDHELEKLEKKMESLKQQSKNIDRALQLFNWEKNPALIDTEYRDRVTAADKEANLPFKK